MAIKNLVPFPHYEKLEGRYAERARERLHRRQRPTSRAHTMRYLRLQVKVLRHNRCAHSLLCSECEMVVSIAKWDCSLPATNLTWRNRHHHHERFRQASGCKVGLGRLVGSQGDIFLTMNRLSVNLKMHNHNIGAVKFGTQ